MPRGLVRRYLPDPDKLREHRALRPLGNLLHAPEIWHFHRRSVAGAAFIGIEERPEPIRFVFEIVPPIGQFELVVLYDQLEEDIGLDGLRSQFDADLSQLLGLPGNT